MKLSDMLMVAILSRCSDAQMPCKQPSATGCTEPELPSPNGVDTNSTRAAWVAYTKMFNKTYSNHEESVRYMVWLSNTLDMIKSNNKSLSFSLGWNQFSDLTREEFKATRLGYKQGQSNSSLLSGFTFLGEFLFSGKLEDLPSDWDWTLSSVQVVTPVKDQGSCGSCWAFSTTGALEGALAVGNGWTKTMSEQQLLDCDQQEAACKGGSPRRAMTWEKAQNVCSEDSYSYRGVRRACDSSRCDTVITQGSIWGAYKVGAHEGATCAAVMQRPLSILVATEGGFMNYQSGIFDGDCGSQVDHAILMVGYGYWNNKAYWKVKNSWSTIWGIDGYALLARGGGGYQQCQILQDVVGVYVYGPYNPKNMQLRGFHGELLSPAEGIIV